MDTNSKAPMDTNGNRSPMMLTEPTLDAVSAAIGKWFVDESFGSNVERLAARGAMGGALFVIRLVQPDDFDRIVSDLGISAGVADELIAAVAGDLHTDTDLDTHEPATIDIDPT